MICGVIQARTGSSRLPNKVLRKLGKVTVIEHLLKQVRGSRYIDEFVLATSDKDQDLPLAAHAAALGLKVYRGDEDRIISRLLGAAELCNAEIVVRLLGDCPLTDPKILDRLVDALLSDPKLDMVTNQNPHTYPDGYDVSVIRINALRKACVRMQSCDKPEHLSSFWESDSGFNTLNIEADDNYFKDYRLTLDYERDFQAISQVVQDLGGDHKIIYLDEVLDYLRVNPDVVALNKEYI